jgi:hypothetical protein
MPNPKLGTVTMDVKGAITAAKAGQVEFRAEKAGIIHAGIGKASFDPRTSCWRTPALVDAIQKAKPTGAKGTYLQKVALSSSMGPGVRVDVASLAPERDTPAVRRRWAGGVILSEPVRDRTSPLRGFKGGTPRVGDGEAKGLRPLVHGRWGVVWWVPAETRTGEPDFSGDLKNPLGNPARGDAPGATKETGRGPYGEARIRRVARRRLRRDVDGRGHP